MWRYLCLKQVGKNLEAKEKLNTNRKSTALFEPSINHEIIDTHFGKILISYLINF